MPLALRFYGNQVANVGDTNDLGATTDVEILSTPFLATDIVEITIKDSAYNATTGEFEPDDSLEYISVRVWRDGTWYDLDASKGDTIQESENGSDPLQGDSYFITDSNIGPSSSGTPFDSIPNGEYIFSTDTTFDAGTWEEVTRTVDNDFNGDGDMLDGNEVGNANFNVFAALNNDICFDYEIPLANGNIKGNDFVDDEENDQCVTLTDGGNLSNVQIAGFGKGTPTNPLSGAGGDDEFYVDLSGFDDDFNVTVKSLDPGDTFYVSKALSWSNVDNTYTINYVGSDSLVHVLTIDVESTNGTGIASIVITCFTKGTKIVTEFGKVAVESLKQGDRVMCGDGQLRPIRWMASRHVSGFELMENPEFRPIRIRKGALGDSRPTADLCVSPQHRILVNDWRAELLFGEAEVLVPAVHLTDDKNITRDHRATEVTYYHFMFDEHQTVWSNGLETESFYPGDTALEGIDQAAKAELFQLFPMLEAKPDTYGETYRPTLKAHEVLTMMGA
jgi:Hint domain-containing protein